MSKTFLLLLLLSLFSVVAFARQRNSFENQGGEGNSGFIEIPLMEGLKDAKLFLEDDGHFSSRSFRSLLLHLADEISSSISEPKKDFSSSNYKYFGFIPTYVGSAFLESTFGPWSAPCFDSNQVSIELIQNASQPSAMLTFEVDNRVGKFACEDLYLVSNTAGAKLLAFIEKGKHQISFSIPPNGNGSFSDAKLWDIQNNGWRIVRFNGDREQMLADIVATADLFIPALFPGPGVPQKTQEQNLEFLHDYVGITMESRNNTLITLNETEIHSGDFFGVIRLDGLDPMLAWGMGANTGHTTIALWFDDELFICESTTNSNYWPTNGIQKTPYLTWLKQAYAADYNVVHLPLAPEFRAIFNESAAIEWFLSKAQGLPYGFNNMLFTWLDTNADNLPCLPPDYSWCLQPKTIEVLASIVDNIDVKLADLMFDLALKRRISPASPDDSLRFPEVLQAASQLNPPLNFSQLVIVPEMDEWIYPTGYQMVCDVFVCEMWKTAGIFGNLTQSIQCTEFTNWDAYSLAIFDSNYVRPQVCVDADPDSDFCQIMGANRMSLPGYNSKKFYPDMAFNCPSRGPEYYRPSDC